MNHQESIEYVADLRAICQKYNLQGASILDKYSDE